MTNAITGASKGLQDQLAKLGRYEALSELTGAINASTNINEICQILARRLKYVADVFAWRYICVHENIGIGSQSSPTAVIIDGFRGRAEIVQTDPASLSELETELWHLPKARVLCEGPEDPRLGSLPDHFRRPDLAQIYSHPLIGSAQDRAIFLFCKRREPFNDLDLKFVTLVSPFFHRRVHMLQAQQMLRQLEVAYVQQEVTLRQSEKLATLGRLSAGMAHELNNPAAAARRGAEQLREVIGVLESTRFLLGGIGLSASQLKEIQKLEDEATARAGQPDGLEAIERSDVEEHLEDWLGDIGLEDVWEDASDLVSMGHTAETLQPLASHFAADELQLVLKSIATRFTVHRLLQEMQHGTSRIVELVRALKSYTYLDQAPLQEVDVRQGLDDTLVMLGSKLKDGVSVTRDYAEDLPRIEAFGSEINQVWTNIVDNAVAAMEGEGTLKLRAYSEDANVVVEIVDDGPGIPNDIQGSVFDPFFTTKAPGEGTGLGLNISHSIVVQKHQGAISLDSRPGETRFVVKLPIALKRPEDDGVVGTESPSPTDLTTSTG